MSDPKRQWPPDPARMTQLQSLWVTLQSLERSLKARNWEVARWQLNSMLKLLQEVENETPRKFHNKSGWNKAKDVLGDQEKYPYG